MDVDFEYLLSFLKDEFQAVPGVDVRPVFPSVIRRAPDLPQDYDPETNDLHRRRGVQVRTRSKEFFFPVDWVSERRIDLVQSLAAAIREFIR